MYFEISRDFCPFQAESISLHDCISETLTLAPRDICARANTFMLENRRSFQNGDREALNMHVVSRKEFLLELAVCSVCTYYVEKKVLSQFAA